MATTAWTLFLPLSSAHRTRLSGEELRAIYLELRRIAQRILGRENGEPTLQPTALVHEALLKLRSTAPHSEERQLVLATGARIMRHILVDHARRRRLRRDFGELQASEADRHEPSPSSRLLDLDDALVALEAESPQLAHVVEQRWFLGRSVQQIAEDLAVSERTVKRRWALARAYLQRHLEGHQL